ncbi:peptidase [Pseudoflavonifractor sp. 524-17]|nr:peptidase [Pseudoflavonifractor sp. 524-17]
MRIFLSADIEGTCGIADWQEARRDTPYDYNYFRRQMTLEVRAACEGAIEAGAAEVFVRDGHSTARNIDPAQLPEGVQMMRGWTGDPLHMMSGLDQGGYDGVFFTGYHAWAGCGGSPLSHTVNLNSEFITLNGVQMSEFLMNAYTAGYYGAAVPFISGDRAVCDFAQELIPNITAVPVHEGRGGAVVSMHPDKAIKAIRAGARRAARNGKRCPVPMPEQFDAVVRFREHQAAYARQFYPGASLEDGKNVCFSTDDWYEMLRFFHFVL